MKHNRLLLTINHLLIWLLFLFWSCQSKEPLVNFTPNLPAKPLGNVVTITNAVEQFGQLQVQGNRIVDKNANPVQLRGMSLFWSLWIGKYYTPETIKWLKDDWRCTMVRAAMAVDYEGYLKKSGSRKAESYNGSRCGYSARVVRYY